MGKAMKRAAIYLRISTQDQTTSNQEHELRQAAERADWQVAKVYRDHDGNPHGNRHRTRHLLNQEFMQALLLHFRQHGKKAIEKVARNQPAAYLKILALLVPREHKVEHSNALKN